MSCTPSPLASRFQRILIWLPMLLSFLVFLIAMFAETNRLPFDLPEAEQELVGGYHTEYSSMGFALFFLGEYAAMIAGSGVIVTLFLGGWSLAIDSRTGPAPRFSTSRLFLHRLASLIWGLVNIGVFFAKVSAMLFVFIWVRWTLPRFRYDQLMKLGWYFFFELALRKYLYHGLGARLREDVQTNGLPAGASPPPEREALPARRATPSRTEDHVQRRKSRRNLRCYPANSDAMSVALWPPKPKGIAHARP